MTYKGTGEISLPKLIDLILDKCKKPDCPEWQNKIEQSLMFRNTTDIINGEIKKFGNLVFYLPTKYKNLQKEFE